MVVVDVARFLLQASPVIEYLLIAGLLVLQIARRPSLLRAAKFSAATLAFLISIKALLLSAAQYATWKAGPPGIYFLPPHQPLSYFSGYAFQHFAKTPVVTLLFAGGLMVALILANRLFQGRFFYDEEPYLAAAGILATGWPNSLIVVGGTILAAVVAHFMRAALKFLIPYSLSRIPFVYFWLPCALAVMIWGDTISRIVGLSQFRL